MRKKVWAQISALVATLGFLAFAALPAYAWNIPTVIELGDPCEMADAVATFAVGVAVAIAVIFLVTGGIQYMGSGGDKMKIENARGRITSAIVGGVIAIAAFGVLHFFIQTVLAGIIPGCTAPFT